MKTTRLLLTLALAGALSITIAQAGEAKECAKAKVECKDKAAKCSECTKDKVCEKCAKAKECAKAKIECKDKAAKCSECTKDKVCEKCAKAKECAKAKACEKAKECEKCDKAKDCCCKADKAKCEKKDAKAEAAKS